MEYMSNARNDKYMTRRLEEYDHSGAGQCV